MPRLGGPSLLRGYREGRFRDRRLAVLEGEVRFPIAWRFGGVVFAGVGDVAHDAGDVPALRELERALGLGVRFRMNDAGVRLRADGAWGREGGGLYLSVGEAF
jgi:outer membrane protein assembly factor BamA